MAFSIAAPTGLLLLPPMPQMPGPSVPVRVTNRGSVTPIAASPEKISVSGFSGCEIHAKSKLILTGAAFAEHALPARPNKKAFIWVVDKTNLLFLAQQLVDLGYEIFSSDDAILFLQKHNIPVKQYSKFRKFGEDDAQNRELLKEGGILEVQQDLDIIIMNLYAGCPERLISREIARSFYFFIMNCENTLTIVDPNDYNKTLLMLQCIEAYGENTVTTNVRVELKTKEERYIKSFIEQTS